MRLSRVCLMCLVLMFVATSTWAPRIWALDKSAVAAPIEARFVGYGHAGTWLVKHHNADAQIVHNPAFATKAQSPASTFKILVALIALETGALRSADEIVPWNGRAYPKHREWQADMALKRAMETSSESYFGVLANRIGRERLAEWVARVGYGNGRIGNDPPNVWHDGVLTVTAMQQLNFIDRLRLGRLPFRIEHIGTVKSALLREQADGRSLYAKTGTHFDGENTGNAWWIGWVEGKGRATTFVLGIELKTSDDRDQRIALGKSLLRDSGAWSAP